MPDVTEAAPAPVPPALTVPAPPVNAPGTGIEVPVAPPPGVEAGPPWIGLGVLALVVVFFAYAFARSRARRRAEFAEEGRREQPRLEQKERPEVPLQPRQVEPVRERPVERVPLEPSPESREADAAAEAARTAAEVAEATRLEAKRLKEQASPDAEKAAEAARVAREQAEALKARALQAEKRAREVEEERKKDEYRQRKAADADEKERRRREAEETRLSALEAERTRLAEEVARKQAEAEEKKKKIAAEGGKTLAEGLARTKGGFMAGLNNFFGRAKTVDDAVLAELEEVLFTADIGVTTATRLLEFAREKVKAKDLDDASKLKAAIREEVQRMVTLPNAAPPDLSSHKPYVIMVVGVNGAGKTTTIGKLANRIAGTGKKVILAAGDTFRAAATEQLEVWAARANVPVVRGKEGSDPGAVVFDAVKRAKEEGFDVVICDTAGRLHTKAPLMEELRRVKRVMEKPLPGAPHEVLLVLDSTNGQNAIAQAREFNAALAVTGIVLTKLDGTAKGGVIIGICDELQVPVRYVGIGEAIADLRPFDPKEFVAALFD